MSRQREEIIIAKTLLSISLPLDPLQLQTVTATAAAAEEDDRPKDSISNPLQRPHVYLIMPMLLPNPWRNVRPCVFLCLLDSWGV
jgi:hypothetical protein